MAISLIFTFLEYFKVAYPQSCYYRFMTSFDVHATFSIVLRIRRPLVYYTFSYILLGRFEVVMVPCDLVWAIKDILQYYVCLNPTYRICLESGVLQFQVIISTQ